MQKRFMQKRFICMETITEQCNISVRNNNTNGNKSNIVGAALLIAPTPGSPYDSL